MTSPEPAAGQVWASRRDRSRHIYIEAVSGFRVHVRRNTSARRQLLNLQTLHKGYDYLRDAD